MCWNPGVPRDAPFRFLLAVRKEKGKERRSANPARRVSAFDAGRSTGEKPILVLPLRTNVASGGWFPVRVEWEKSLSEVVRSSWASVASCWVWCCRNARPVEPGAVFRTVSHACASQNLWRKKNASFVFVPLGPVSRYPFLPTWVVWGVVSAFTRLTSAGCLVLSRCRVPGGRSRVRFLLARCRCAVVGGAGNAGRVALPAAPRLLPGEPPLAPLPAAAHRISKI